MHITAHANREHRRTFPSFLYHECRDVSTSAIAFAPKEQMAQKLCFGTPQAATLRVDYKMFL
jgi:hypothetical protein